MNKNYLKMCMCLHAKSKKRWCILKELCMSKKWFFIQMSIIHDIIASQVADKRRWGFGQWMNSSIIHDNTCSLIHDRCYPKSNHSYIKYHMTLNIIFSVVQFKISKLKSWSKALKIKFKQDKTTQHNIMLYRNKLLPCGTTSIDFYTKYNI